MMGRGRVREVRCIKCVRGKVTASGRSGQKIDNCAIWSICIRRRRDGVFWRRRSGTNSGF